MSIIGILFFCEFEIYPTFYVCKQWRQCWHHDHIRFWGIFINGDHENARWSMTNHSLVRWWPSPDPWSNIPQKKPDLLHKSHNALDKYPTMHHFVTDMCTYVHISVTKWCIVGYLSNALWDLWDWSNMHIWACHNDIQLYNILKATFYINLTIPHNIYLDLDVCTWSASEFTPRTLLMKVQSLGGHRWIPLTQGQLCGALRFSMMLA